MNNHQQRFPRLAERLGQLCSLELDELERLATKIESARKDALLESESGDESPHSKSLECDDLSSPIPHLCP